jgi:hypothetical protein
MFSEAYGGRFEGEHSSNHVLGSLTSQHRFTHEILSTNLPKRRDAPGQVNPEYQAKVVELHGAILGATALVEAFPYTVPKFLRKLIIFLSGALLTRQPSSLPMSLRPRFRNQLLSLPPSGTL